MVWFLPLMLTPVFLIELLFCFSFCGTKSKLMFIAFMALSILLTIGSSHVGLPNKAIWSTTTGFILHDSIRPKATLPQTVVVRVKASALNPADYKVFNRLQSIPFVRWFVQQTPTYDLSGVVVESKCADRFKVGDEIFGQGLGGAQEYAIMYCPHSGIKPKSVSFQQAAASVTVMYTGFTALRPLQTNANSIVVIGASGGCGQAGIAIAKMRKVKHIVCIASSKNRDEVMAKGCTEFFDYQSPQFFEDIAKKWNGKVDFVYDTVTEVFTSPYYPKLKALLADPNGRYVGLNVNVDAIMHPSEYSRYEHITAIPTREEVQLMESNPSLFGDVKLALVLNGLSVENINRAYSQLLTHRTVGKIVLAQDSS